MTDQTAPTLSLPDGWRLADHKKYGRVMVTNPTPDACGYIYFVRSDDEFVAGFDWAACLPDELTYIDTGQEAGTSDTVPPNTLAVGSEWDDPEALDRACKESKRDQIIVLDRAGDAYVWAHDEEWWESVPPMSVNGPFTIIHEGKKVDQ